MRFVRIRQEERRLEATDVDVERTLVAVHEEYVQPAPRGGRGASGGPSVSQRARTAKRAAVAYRICLCLHNTSLSHQFVDGPAASSCSRLFGLGLGPQGGIRLIDPNSSPDQAGTPTRSGVSCRLDKRLSPSKPGKGSALGRKKSLLSSGVLRVDVSKPKA